MKRIVAALVLALAGTALQAQPMPEVNAEYTLHKGFLTLGTARFTLEPLPEAGDACYRYAYVARPTGMAKLFIGRIEETSEFCYVEGLLQTRIYRFSREDRPEGDYTLRFDFDQQQARTDQGQVQTFEGPATDRLALQLVVQRWVITRNGVPGPQELPVQQVEDDRVKTYRFRITDRETVKVDGRRIETVRVERVDDPDKSVRFWMDPRDGWRVVQVEHIEDGSTQFTMELTSG